MTLKNITKLLINNSVTSTTNVKDFKRKNFTNNTKRELQYVLFYQTLNQIAIRATSLNNPYTAYVKKYSRYFRANQDSSVLVVNQQILLALLKEFPKSQMTMYFEGW